MRYMPLLVSSVLFLHESSRQAQPSDFMQESTPWDTPVESQLFEPGRLFGHSHRSRPPLEAMRPVEHWEVEEEWEWLGSPDPLDFILPAVGFLEGASPLPPQPGQARFSEPAIRRPAPDMSELEPEDFYTWQYLPTGIIYKSYIAGPRESRFATTWFHSQRDHTVWDTALGGKMGLVRYGNTDPLNPRGWQFDVEGAVFTRLDPNNRTDVDAADYRFALPYSWRNDEWQVKFGYYHISSHVGDEFLERNPEFTRDNYVREAFQIGVGYFLNPDLRTYAEAGYAIKSSGAADKWEVQFGMDYSPWVVQSKGTPFAAVNTYFREEINWGAGVSMAAGWQWISEGSGAVFRVGLHSYLGRIYQFSFVQDRNQYEKFIGFGLSYDF